MTVFKMLSHGCNIGIRISRGITQNGIEVAGLVVRGQILQHLCMLCLTLSAIEIAVGIAITQNEQFVGVHRHAPAQHLRTVGNVGCFKPAAGIQELHIVGRGISSLAAPCHRLSRECDILRSVKGNHG